MAVASGTLLKIRALPEGLNAANRHIVLVRWSLELDDRRDVQPKVLILHCLAAVTEIPFGQPKAALLAVVNSTFTNLNKMERKSHVQLTTGE